MAEAWVAGPWMGLGPETMGYSRKGAAYLRSEAIAYNSKHLNMQSSKIVFRIRCGGKNAEIRHREPLNPIVQKT